MFVFALLPSFASAQFRVRVNFNEIANLTYQLDCASGLSVVCSQTNYRELWNRNFLKNDRDRAQLGEWNRLRTRYAEQVALKATSAAENTIYLSLFDKIRIAGFQASNFDDYARRLDLLTAPADRAAFEKVLRHFYPTFSAWWKHEAAAKGANFANRTQTLLNSPNVSHQLKQFYAFYAPVLPADYEISLTLFYRPVLIDEPTNGQQLENYSLAEFKLAERPADRLDVVVHELCHFFYQNAKASDAKNLRERFRAERTVAATPAYNLLNEALATAFGNGMIARKFRTKADWERYFGEKLSFYNDEAIDRAAKILLPFLEKWLADGKTLHSADFVSGYVSLLEREFGGGLTRPELYLREMFLFVDGGFGAQTLRRDLRTTIQVSSLYASQSSLSEPKAFNYYNNNPDLNSVLLVRPDNVNELANQKIISAADAKIIADEYARSNKVLYATERAPFVYVFVIVAKDAADAKQLLETLARAEMFRGVYKIQ